MIYKIIYKIKATISKYILITTTHRDCIIIESLLIETAKLNRALLSEIYENIRVYYKL